MCDVSRGRPNCDGRHCERACDVLSCKEQREAIMSSVLAYNPVLIDERNEQLLLIAFVATVVVWTVAVLIWVA